MTKKEQITELLSDPMNKRNYEAIANSISRQFVSSLNQSGDFEGADLLEELLEESKKIINWENILPILEYVYDQWYNEEEINFLYEQTMSPLSKQIAEKVAKVQIDLMEKMDEAFKDKLMEIALNDNKA